MNQSSYAHAGTNGATHPAAKAPVHSSPASPADYATDYEGENQEGGMPSSAFGIPTFQFDGGVQPSRSVAGSSASEMALASVRKILGSTFRPGDPEGYRRLLNRNFKLKIVEGHVESEYTPSGWSGTSSPADLTGAMAVFYAHADSTATQLKTQIRQMEPMSRIGPDKPDVCCEDIRNVLSDKLDELIGAMAVTGGPCVERVGSAFSGLQDLLAIFQSDYIGKDTTDNGGGIFCPEDARRLAQFRLFDDSLGTLKKRWENFAAVFLLGSGGAAVAASIQKSRRQLHVIKSAASDVIRGLKCAGWSKAARDLVEIDTGGPTVGSILDWTTDFSRRALGALQTPGPGILRTLESEANQLKGYADRLGDWVSTKVLSGLPCQIADLMEAGEVAKAENTKAEAARKAKLAGLNKALVKCDADLKDVEQREAAELARIDKQCAADLKKKGARKQAIQRKAKRTKKECQTTFEAKRADLISQRKDLSQQVEALLAPTRALEPELSKSVTPITQTAMSGLRWVVYGIPAAADLLRGQLGAFATRMKQLADNCKPPTNGEPKNYYQANASPAASGAGEGEYEASQNPGPSAQAQYAS